MFDPAAGVSPLPPTNPCTAPAGYTFDEIRDEVRMDQQGSVFATLPEAMYPPGTAASSTYVPVAAEWPKSSAGQPCQKFKSRAQVESALGAQMPSGKFLAWLVIDPAAAVYRHDQDPDADPRGLDLQKWGWFRRYLLAYLDGGYIPTVEEMVTEAGVSKQVIKMRPQRLYYPRSLVITTAANGMTAMAAGVRGAGYDVLEAKRGDADYSPVCEVFTYEASPMPMALTPALLPKSVAEIEAIPARRCPCPPPPVTSSACR